MSEMQTLRWICDQKRQVWLRAIRKGESEWKIRQFKKDYFKALEMKNAEETNPKNISPES